MRRLGAWLALLLAAATPSALAHVGAYSDAQTLNAGHYYAFVAPAPSPMYATHEINWSVQFSPMDSKPTGNRSTSLTFNDTEGWSRTILLGETDPWNAAASLTFPHPGNFTANLTIRDDTTSGSNVTTFHVYPDLAIRLVPADPALDARTNRTTSIHMMTTDRDGSPTRAAFSTLDARAEHWDQAHTLMYGAELVPMKRVNDTTWELDYRFNESGMFHLRFASTEGGFTFDDVPLMHLYPIEPDPPQNALPAPTLVMVVAVITLASLLRRRLT